MRKPIVHSLQKISLHRSYHGWPTVGRREDGELLVVVSAGRERHVCPFGQVHLFRSSDRGKTWSRPEILANGPLDDRDAGILVTRKGTVLVNWFTSVAWLRNLEQREAEASDPQAVACGGEDDGFVSRCRKVRALLTDETIRKGLGTWMLRSTDGARTWSAPFDCGAGSPHGPTELDDGRLLFVGNWNAETRDARASTAYDKTLGATVSEDDGQTWRRLGAIPLRPGDTPGNYHESHAVQAADGRIVVHIRNHNEQDRGHVLQSESADGGKTFSVPRDTGLVGFPAHLLKLRDGRLLSTFGYRILPYGNHAALSDDHGETWSGPMVLDEKPVARDLGYPSSVELDDGSIYSVWYEKLPGDALASVQGAHWSLPEA